MPHSARTCTCRGKRRVPSGRVYLGHEYCTRCGGVWKLPRQNHRRPAPWSEPPPPQLGRLSLSEGTVSRFAEFRLHVFKKAGLEYPSRYKGMGGSVPMPQDPLAHLLHGQVAGAGRLSLADRLHDLRNEVDLEHHDRLMDLVFILRGLPVAR